MSQILKDVYEVKYGKIDFKTEPLSMANLRELAGICGDLGLSVTDRHLHSVIKGHQKPKDGLDKVLQIHANRLDGQSIIQARAREITCLTVNGVVPGSVILGHTRYCLYCYIPFVGAPKRKYCCPEHGRLYRKQQRQAEREG